MSNKKQIIAIETDNGVYVKKAGDYNGFPSYLFDGKMPEKTYMSDWGLIKKLPKKIEYTTSQPNINHRYELDAEALESSGFSGKTLGHLQPVLKREDVAYESDYSWYWKEEFKHLASLYKSTSDNQPDLILPVECDFKVILKIDKIKGYAGLSYPVQKTQWSHEGTRLLNESEVIHQEIDKILFPKPILPSRPCKLSSPQVYKIVRQHIKVNIDHRVCEITSDYDFCFTVKKRVLPAETALDDIYRQENNHKARYRPKMDMFTVFEMTDDKRNYQGYTPIKAVIANNHRGLKQKIDKMLKDIIEDINKPIKLCPYCDGKGIEEIEHKKE